jgi:hypothetical protein
MKNTGEVNFFFKRVGRIPKRSTVDPNQPMMNSSQHQQLNFLGKLNEGCFSTSLPYPRLNIFIHHGMLKLSLRLWISK